MPFTAEFDVIFSNAVFHWIKDHDALLKAIYRAMRDNGKLICEFGGSRNIAKIEAAFACAYAETGRDYHSEFNFPEVKTFSGLLEKNGFKIELIYDFDRSKGGYIFLSRITEEDLLAGRLVSPDSALNLEVSHSRPVSN